MRHTSASVRNPALLLLLGLGLSVAASQVPVGLIPMDGESAEAWLVLARGGSELAQLGCLVWLGVLTIRQGHLEGAGWLLPIAAVALGVRVVAALGLHGAGLAIGPRALVLDDESVYDHTARAVLGLVADPQGGFPGWQDHAQFEGPYVSLLALVYAIGWSDPLAGRVVGALIGTGVVLLAAVVSGSLFGRGAGVAVGATLAVMPSLVGWSATLLRDSLIVALALLAFWTVRLWYMRPSWTLGVMLVAVVYLLVGLRLYVGLAVGLLVGVSLLVSLGMHVRAGGLRTHARALGLSLALLAILSVSQLGPALAANLDPVRLLYQRTVMGLVPPPYELLGWEAEGAARARVTGGPIVAARLEDGQPELPGMIVASMPGEPADRETMEHFVALDRQTLVLVSEDDVRPITAMDRGVALGHLTQGFLHGLAAALFAPFSTGIAGLSYYLVAVDAVLWLGMLTLGIAGAVRSRHPYLLLPLGFVLAVVLVLAIVPGHPGNLVRHRAVLTFPALAIAAGPALLPLASWASSRLLRGKRLTAPLDRSP